MSEIFDWISVLYIRGFTTKKAVIRKTLLLAFLETSEINFSEDFIFKHIPQVLNDPEVYIEEPLIQALSKWLRNFFEKLGMICWLLFMQSLRPKIHFFFWEILWSCIQSRNFAISCCCCRFFVIVDKLACSVV